jgi:hypothetical protein
MKYKDNKLNELKEKFQNKLKENIKNNKLSEEKYRLRYEKFAEEVGEEFIEDLHKWVDSLT